MKKLTFLFLIALMPMMAGAQNAYKKASTTAATAKAMNPPTPNSLTKKIVMERRYLVNKANNYCYPATCFRMDNNLQLEIRYFNTDHYQGSYSVTRHGIYIAVGRCEDVNFDWNVKDCDYFDAWHVCAVTTDQWVNEKIEFDESGNVSYYMNGKYMGTHMFEMLKKLAGSKTVTFDINPYGWYTGQHHYMDDLKLTLPGKTISDNFNDGVIDSKIWQTPTNPSGVREEGGILKTEQVRTDWPYHFRTIALSLTGGSQNSSSNSTLAQKTTNSTPTQKATTSSATAQSKSSQTTSQNSLRNYLLAGATESIAFNDAVSKSDYAKLAASGQAAFENYKKAYAAALNKYPSIAQKAQEGALKIYEKTNGLSSIGLAYYQQKEYRKALDAWHASMTAFKEPVLTSNPDAQGWIKEYSQSSFIDKSVEYCVSVSYHNLEDKEAIKELLFLKPCAIGQDAKNKVYEALALKYRVTDDMSAYESTIKEAAGKFPDEPLYIAHLVDLYSDRKDYNSAIQIIDKALVKDPNSVHYNRLKGYTLEQQGKVEAALPFYEKAIKLDPNDLTTITLIGLYYVRRAEAIQDKYNELKQYEEGNRQAAPFFEKALPYYEKAWSLDKENKGNGYVLRTLYIFKAQQAGENTPEGKLWIEKWKKLRTELGIE